MSTVTPSIAFPEPFERIGDLISRAFGTSEIATRLLMLNAVGAAIGNSRRIQTSNCQEFIPAINLGFVRRGDALIQGAQMSLLAPIQSVIHAAREFRDLRGFAYSTAKLESLLSERRELESRIASGERELEALGRTGVATPEEQAASAAEIMSPEFTGGSSPMARRRDLAESLPLWRQQLESARDYIAQGYLESRGHVLLKDRGWQELPESCSRSFDGNRGFLVYSPHVLGELCVLPHRDLHACAAALQRTLTGSSAPGKARADLLPGAWASVCGSAELWSQIISRPVVAESGMFHDFVFCSADTDLSDCDPVAMAEFRKDPTWSEFLLRVFSARLCNSRRVLNFNCAGTTAFLTLRRWSRQFADGLDPEVRPYFAHWPDVAARIALTLAVMNDAVKGETLPESFVASACNFVRGYAPIQAELLQRFHAGDSRAVESERQIRRLVEKLRIKGPLSLRGLVRSYDRQDYVAIEGWLQLAVERGLAEQRGALFFAATVSGSAVSAANVVNFPDPVSR